jgi:hypothetical protein
MFLLMWSSSGVKIIGRGNCSFLLLLMLLIYQFPRCACVFDLVGCVLSFCVLCCVSCSRMHTGTLDAHACLCWWVVFSLFVCCAACLVLECIQVLSMRMRVCVSGLCSLLLFVVLRVLFSNAYRYSRCACVFVLVGCVLSCCVLCCVSCSRMIVPICPFVMVSFLQQRRNLTGVIRAEKYLFWDS